MDKNFTLDTFKNAWKNMIATSEDAYSRNRFGNYVEKSKDYTKEEIQNIIDSGSLSEKITLSRNYFRKDGFYRRIVLHYATLLKYQGLLIPNPSFGQKLSTSKLQKRYFNALDFTETMDLSQKAIDWSVRALRDGSYYGVIVQLDKNNFAMLDLPATYCRSRFKDASGNNVIEFNVSYFDTLIDEKGKEAAFNTYPKFVVNYYKRAKKDPSINRWCLIPTDIGICFKFVDGSPMFLNVIPASIDYDKAVETENERELEEIKKIIVQKIPHLQDGGLLFEPDEAAEMHKGAVNMMKGNKNISVLTTYADVDGIVSRTSGESTSNNLEKMVQNIYYESGASGQLFASNSNLSLSTSLKNDMALMMIVVKQYNTFITNIINKLYANGALKFTYEFLPITWYNDDEVFERSFKMATSGYSFLMPALASGISQRDLVNIKELENDVLKLDQVLKPLASAYTAAASDSQGGAPTKAPEDKAEKTVANETSLDKGGSN